MAAPGTWHNPDGLLQKFADYQKNAANFINRPRAVVTDGLIKQIVIDYDLAQLVADGGTSFQADLNNDGTKDGFTTGDVYLPGSASVLRVSIFPTESAASGTSITVGTYGPTGTAIDADGLVTATEAVTANLATGKRVNGAGAFVALTSNAGTTIGAANGYLAIAATGTFTAGKGRILIEYVDPVADVA